MSRALEHLQCKFTVKTASKEGRIEGLGAVFGNIDDGFDVIHPGAFEESLKVRQPLMFWQHDSTDPVGVWDDVSENDDGLQVAGDMVLVSPEAKQRHALLKAGALDGLSIGYMVAEDGARYDDLNVRHLLKLELWEVSIVSFPMNREARISAIKTMAGYNRVPTPRQAERLLRDGGWSPAQAKALLNGGFEALKAVWPEAENAARADRDLVATINLARGIL